jgi:type II secretory pathway predicted ATPase ExeA
MIETPTAPAADLGSHFGLSEIPFTREISVESRWHSPQVDEPLADLVRTIDQRMSALLIAPAGTGKTALLRALVARLPEARYKVPRGARHPAHPHQFRLLSRICG